MQYYATIQVGLTYKVEAESHEQAEEFFRNRGISISEDVIESDPNWNTLVIEEI